MSRAVTLCRLHRSSENSMKIPSGRVEWAKVLYSRSAIHLSCGAAVLLCCSVRVSLCGLLAL